MITWICKICGKKFYNREALKLHIKVDHLVMDKVKMLELIDVELN